MSHTITLTVSHPEQTGGRIEGFRYFWAYYIDGYNPEQHCQPGLRGRLLEEMSTKTAEVGRVVRADRMDRYPYLYICGVGSGPKKLLREKNLHFPLEYAEGEVAEITTYNGYRVRAENARQLPIPELPDGRQGLEEEHTRCKNFRFAVSRFGYPPGL